MWFISEATNEDEDALSECELPPDKCNKIAFAPSEDSNQPERPPSLIRVFAVRSKDIWGPNVSSCGQRRLRSDRADVLADLCLHWAQWPFCWFWYAAAYVYIAAESPCVESVSECGSMGCWFDSDPATNRSLKLIMRIFSFFSLTEKCRCLTYETAKPAQE